MQTEVFVLLFLQTVCCIRSVYSRELVCVVYIVCTAGVCYVSCTLLSTDVDECRVSADNNCRYACKNIVGSFVCVCPPGYQQIGPSDMCQGLPPAPNILCVCVFI